MTNKKIKNNPHTCKTLRERYIKVTVCTRSCSFCMWCGECVEDHKKIELLNKK